MRKMVFVKMFSVRPQICSSVKKFLRLLQNRVQATHLYLKGDDLGSGTPGLGDDLGWGDEATRDAQGCGGGPPPLGLLERDIMELRQLFIEHMLKILDCRRVLEYIFNTQAN